MQEVRSTGAMETKGCQAPRRRGFPPRCCHFSPVGMPSSSSEGLLSASGTTGLPAALSFTMFSHRILSYSSG